MAIASTTVPHGPVVAKLNYYSPPANGEKPFNHVDTPPEGLPVRNFDAVSVDTLIHDIRGHESNYSLDRDAFAVIQDVPESKEKDFVDDESVQANYYPEVVDLLLKNIPGAQRVFIFDHTIRRADPNASRGPVTRTHIDQTPVSAAMRVRRHLGDDAESLLQGRYRIINVWRPLNKKPVESFPLAFASSNTVDDADVIPVEHRYANGYNGFTAAIRYNRDQQWHYLSGMTGNERLLLECFDSEALKPGSGVQGGRLAHSAFEDPRTHPDAEGRESIEVRTLVFGP
ncbi:hypothetical protein M406DRAFT_356101 [Cryphonectria parasitica EP155]|uniref:Methyltransferase n=1 Tax=Cryphonectria parasitica (strain ATCC 38755 / EP155) TaxID=660469 RepID=A0A9P5CQ47_CRYP1|nr:uncharacterized protein M406DRAFT_356101 [Cryphonectria parasitica EP155]KAF3765876.1 hypothetical protein M406DRAFT_356101 [Cryphonectria parasitica EP155]